MASYLIGFTILVIILFLFIRIYFSEYDFRFDVNWRCHLHRTIIKGFWYGRLPAFLILTTLGVLVALSINKFEKKERNNFQEVKKQNKLIYDSLLSVLDEIRRIPARDSSFSSSEKISIKSIDSLNNIQTAALNDFLVTTLNKGGQMPPQTIDSPDSAPLFDYSSILNGFDSLNGIQTRVLSEFLSKSLGVQEQKVQIKPRIVRFIPMFLLVLSAIFYFFYSKSKTKGFLLFSSLSAAASIGYGLKINFDPEFGFDINIDKTTCVCDTSKTVSFTMDIPIGPFDDGFNTLPDSILKNGLNSIKKEFGEKKIITIYITGGVDKRQLRGKSKERFGDNFMLAQARANKIKTILTDTSQFKYSGVEYRVNVSAANIFKDSVSISELAQDRVVKVSATYLSKSD